MTNFDFMKVIWFNYLPFIKISDFDLNEYFSERIRENQEFILNIVENLRLFNRIRMINDYFRLENMESERKEENDNTDLKYISLNKMSKIH